MTNWLTELRYDVARTSAQESSGLLKFTDPRDDTTVAGSVPIVGVVMPEAPDEVVAMSATVLVESAETIVMLALRFRAQTEARLDEIGDTLDNIWTKRDAGTLGAVKLIMSQWASGASLGQDEALRLARSATYYLTVFRPLANRY